jgi:hypothetical protein
VSISQQNYFNRRWDTAKQSEQIRTMKNKFLFLAAAMFAALTFAACDPANPGGDDDGGGGGNTGKMIEKITFKDEDVGITLTYDDEERVVKLFYGEGTDHMQINLEYFSDRVVLSDSDDWVATAALVGGKITEMTEEDDQPGDFYDFSYNGDRLASHSEPYANYIATWTDGNVTKVVNAGPLVPEPGTSYTVYTELFEYTSYDNEANLDLNHCPNPMSELWGDNDVFLTWTNLMGARCKNLVSKITSSVQHPEEGQYVRSVNEFSYTFDKEGYVTKIVRAYKYYGQDGTLSDQGAETYEITYK